VCVCVRKAGSAGKCELNLGAWKCQHAEATWSKLIVQCDQALVAAACEATLRGDVDDQQHLASTNKRRASTENVQFEIES
jgi:hypothetical protein